MLLEDIKWVGERVHLHFYDLDGSRETIILYPSEALDILGWLLQEQPKLLQVNAAHIEELQRREENVN